MLDVRKMAANQNTLIDKAATLVKPGGVLVYSTCSIEPEENFEVVDRFLNNHPGFELQPAGEFFNKGLIDENGCIQTLPHLHHMDGAFAAKLVRKN